jgi:hypothetical protein
MKERGKSKEDNAGANGEIALSADSLFLFLVFIRVNRCASVVPKGIR